MSHSTTLHGLIRWQSILPALQAPAYLVAGCLLILGALQPHFTSAAWQDEYRPRVRSNAPQGEKVQRFLGNQTHSDHFKLLEKDGDHLLVGARNIVYNLSLDTLQEKKRLEWYSSDEDINMCKMKGKSEEECQNYIRVLARKSEDTILVCGTNAFKPLCRHYLQDADYTMVKEASGEGLCPYDPTHNSTAIFADGDLYVATVAQFTGADPLIYRDPLRTEQFNWKHLNAPNFVSSVHHEEFVYFFFRETAVEYINCGKAVYSRVARVCTKDKGGPHKFRNRWTSFLKARLNCSIPGEFPFYFNEIQSTTNVVTGKYGSKEAQLIYAVFTTPPNSISGSAVCAFRLEDVFKAFNGPFKGQDDINANWLPVASTKVPEPRPGQCVNDSRTLPEVTVNFIESNSLMDGAVPAFWNHPVVLHTVFQYRFTQITVDPQIQTADEKHYDVLYVGTDNGKVLKCINAGSDSTSGKVIPVVIEEFQVFQNTPITNLMVYHTPSDAKLVVVSREEIKTIPLYNCDHYAKTCGDCVALQDPYCAWDKSRNVCTSSRTRSLSLRLWKRDQFVQNVEEGFDPRCREGRSSSGGTTPQRSPHHSASRHDTPGGSPPSSPSANDIEEEDFHEGGTAGASRGHQYMYTAETLAIAVTTSIVSSLVVGFISGYIFSRRCKSEEVDSPYDDSHYLEQRGSCDTPHLNHTEGFLSPTTNKPINLVLNVPPKNGNGKTANSSADNRPVQKVKKIYL
ncbi:semaphorin-1A isoform X3 [Parasteatoda tepidariorum]|uniref:semaphorin-1A isoform X3 n=1 Tax=Parasteatoda tepidariorum TaxID=114398 RepID=UPI000A2C079E|nr:semaphorin-1A isoform X1 [Parasteatoda tepidariorum]XP_042904608.1 semaphorin-1A isoform X1 [Parasteatoda tepidariorum]